MTTMKRPITRLELAIVLVLLISAAAYAIQVNAFYDFIEIGAPSNPGASNDRLYANSGTHQLACLTSSGGSCMPSGGGGVSVSGFFLNSGASYWADQMFTPVTLPVFTGFTATNNTGITKTSQGNGVTWSMVGGGTGQGYFTHTVSAPWTYTVMFHSGILLSVNEQHMGLVFFDSGSGKAAPCYLSTDTGQNTGFAFNSQKWNSATSFNSSYKVAAAKMPDELWIQIHDDGTTNRTCGYSIDGVNFTVFDTEARTDFLTPDSYGVLAAVDGTVNYVFTIMSALQN